MQSTLITRLIGALTIALPLVATAAQERPPFEQADANGDGTITVEEATDAGVPEAEAKREDIDNDGELTKADWKFVDMEGMEDKDSGDGGNGDAEDGG